MCFLQDDCLHPRSQTSFTSPSHLSVFFPDLALSTSQIACQKGVDLVHCSNLFCHEVISWTSWKIENAVRLGSRGSQYQGNAGAATYPWIRGWWITRITLCLAASSWASPAEQPWLPTSRMITSKPSATPGRDAKIQKSSKSGQMSQNGSGWVEPRCCLGINQMGNGRSTRLSEWRLGHLRGTQSSANACHNALREGLSNSAGGLGSRECGPSGFLTKLLPGHNTRIIGLTQPLLIKEGQFVTH